MKRLTGLLQLMPLASRSLSRSPRTRAGAGLHGALARLLAGVSAAALLFAAQTSDRLQRGPSVDAFDSASPTTLAVLHSVPSHRLALESRSPARSPARWTNRFDAALPAFARATHVREAAHHVVAVAPSLASASIAGRGYDATAPPALS